MMIEKQLSLFFFSVTEQECVCSCSCHDLFLVGLSLFCEIARNNKFHMELQ